MGAGMSDRMESRSKVDWKRSASSPEAIWHLWVEDFMAIVTMDAHGQSLHKQVLEESKERLAALKA